MLNIRPITDLRNNTSEISKIVNETQEIMIITKRGYADMVILSPEQYEYLVGEKRIDAALRIAEKEALSNAPRSDFREVAAEIRKKVRDSAEDPHMDT